MPFSCFPNLYPLTLTTLPAVRCLVKSLTSQQLLPLSLWGTIHLTTKRVAWKRHAICFSSSVLEALSSHLYFSCRSGCLVSGSTLGKLVLPLLLFSSVITEYILFPLVHKAGISKQDCCLMMSLCLLWNELDTLICCFKGYISTEDDCGFSSFYGSHI